MNGCRKKKLVHACPAQRRDSGNWLADDTRGPSEALGRMRGKKNGEKDGGGGMAVGNLLHNALLLGNSSNSTRQSGGYYRSGLMHRSCSYTRHYKKAERTETHAVRRGQVGGAFQDDTEETARAGRRCPPHR